VPSSGFTRVAFAILALVFSSLFSASAARAQCGGFCVYEVATPQMGSSYAGFAAVAQDAATVYLNPAGMTRLEKAEVLGGAYAAFFKLKFDTNQSGTAAPFGGGNGGSGNGFLPGVGSYAVVPITDDLRVGMAINGLFGGSVDYSQGWVARTFITELSLITLNFQPTLAYRVTDWLSLGAGLNVLRTELDKFELNLTPLGGGPSVNANGADDWSVAGTFGVLLEPVEGTRLGVTYRTKSDANLTGGNASNFKFNFNYPQGFNVSLFHQLNPAVALLFDAGWSDWSDFSQNSVRVRGADVSFDRKWDDTWRVAGGLQYSLGESWLLQGGVSYDSSPVKNKRRTPDLPVSEQYRFSAGVQHKLRSNLTVGLTYTFLWFGNPKIRKVDIPGLGAPSPLDGEYDPSYGMFFGLTAKWEFCSPLPWASCPDKS